MKALITGTNRGIGAALLRHLEAVEHDVLGTSRDGSTDLTLDVTDSASIQALVTRLGSEPLDLLVCNAEISVDKGLSLDTGFSADMWAEAFQVNIAGVFLTIQACMPALRRAATPKIAIVSSKMGSRARPVAVTSIDPQRPLL